MYIYIRKGLVKERLWAAGHSLAPPTSLEDINGMEGVAVETPLSMKSCRIHLERNKTESKYEREMGHGHQITSVAASASANDPMFACSVKSSLQQYSSN